MSLKTDLLQALKDFDSKIQKVRLNGADHANSLLRRNGLTWPDVIGGSLKPDVRDKLLSILASMSSGSKDAQISSINTAQRLLRAVKVSWDSVLVIPAQKSAQSGGPSSVQASKFLRFISICHRHGGRYYTVARRINEFTIELCAVEPFVQKAGDTAATDETLTSFEGKIGVASDWPGCPFCGGRGFVRHQCQTTPQMFCWGDQKIFSCPICKGRWEPIKAEVFEVSTEDVKVTAPRLLGGPGQPPAISGPSSMRSLPPPRK